MAARLGVEYGGILMSQALAQKLASKLVANLKANSRGSAREDAARDERDAKVKPTEQIPFGEGTSSFHRDQALAHLDAAGKHAEAAHSARVVTEAGSHDEAVGNARAATERVR